MKLSFGVVKFRTLLVAGTFSVLASLAVRLSDSLIAGNLLGEQALAGVNLVTPALTFVSFLSGLVATGTGTHYSTELGHCDLARARRYFMQGIWSVLMFGGIFALIAFFANAPLVGFYGAGAEVSGFARNYLSGLSLFGVVDGLYMLLAVLCYADGDVKVCLSGCAVMMVGNALFSILLVYAGLGTTGCALGSVLGEFCASLVLATHFLRRTNSFAPVRHFSLMDTVRIVTAAFGDAAAFLCEALLFLFLNKWVLVHPNLGPSWLPVLAVVNSLWGLNVLFDGIGSALQPIVSVYYGEGNHRSVRTVMNYAMKVSLFEALLITLALLAFPCAVVAAFGVTDPAIAAKAVFAVRAISCVFLFMSFAGLYNSYYMFIERPTLAGGLTFLSYLIMPVCCAVSGTLIAPSGLFAGLVAGPFLGICLTALITMAFSGFVDFPLCLSREREKNIRVFDLKLDDDSIVRTSRLIGETPGVPMRAALLAEEVFEVVKDRNRGRKVLGEATLDLNDGVKLTLRDDGEIFDITDADQRISSLRSFLVASMMANHAGRLNLVTTGFNRNVFKF